MVPDLKLGFLDEPSPSSKREQLRLKRQMTMNESKMMNVCHSKVSWTPSGTSTSQIVTPLAVAISTEAIAAYNFTAKIA